MDIAFYKNSEEILLNVLRKKTLSVLLKYLFSQDVSLIL